MTSNDIDGSPVVLSESESARLDVLLETTRPSPELCALIGARDTSPQSDCDDHRADGPDPRPDCACAAVDRMLSEATTTAKRPLGRVLLVDRDMFRSLTSDEYEAAPAASREQIRDALRKGRDDLRRATATPKPPGPPAHLRFR